MGSGALLAGTECKSLTSALWHESRGAGHEANHREELVHHGDDSGISASTTSDDDDELSG